MGGEGGLATAVRLRIRRLTVALGRASVREGVDVLVISLLLVLGLAARDRRRAPGSPPPAPRLAVDQGGRSLRLGSVIPVGWPKAWKAGRWWGEAGRRVDPAAIAGAVERAVTDRGLAAELRRRGVERARRFTWERTARATLSVLAEAAGRSHARKAEAGCDPPARGAASYID